jgi:hypothetical protein
MITGTKEQLSEKFDLMISKGMNPVLSNSRGVKFIVREYSKSQYEDIAIIEDGESGEKYKVDLEGIMDRYKLEF